MQHREKLKSSSALSECLEHRLLADNVTKAIGLAEAITVDFSTYKQTISKPEIHTHLNYLLCVQFIRNGNKLPLGYIACTGIGKMGRVLNRVLQKTSIVTHFMDI